MDILRELLANKILISGICGWTVAQVLKLIIHSVVTKDFSIERLFGDGGMPSGHSATVSAMATASYMIYGRGSFEFAVTVMLAIIVMHDAMGVRLETSKQAVVINQMVDLIRNMGKKIDLEEKLKEFVGHTPIQVVAGSLLGILVGVLVNMQ